MLENMRFNPGEMKNEDTFAKNLSSLGDIYINEAFHALIENRHRYIR